MPTVEYGPRSLVLAYLHKVNRFQMGQTPGFSICPFQQKANRHVS
jgi:hypothetical protein